MKWYKPGSILGTTKDIQSIYGTERGLTWQNCTTHTHSDGSDSKQFSQTISGVAGNCTRLKNYNPKNSNYRKENILSEKHTTKRREV